MLSLTQHSSGPGFDPAPCTCSKEEIRKAQAIREALERELLNRPELKVSGDEISFNPAINVYYSFRASWQE